MARECGIAVPSKKSKVDLPGFGSVDAVEVSVLESTECWTEVKLDDGSSIRLKFVILGAVRVENQWDANGNPLYGVKVNDVMVVTNAPDHLRKWAPVEGVQ